MKKILAFFVTLFFISAIQAQITVYPNNNVGVKTSTAPTEALEVSGTVKATSFVGNGSLLTGLPGGGSSQWTTSGTKVYYNSGHVGIGTTNPLSKISVGGDGSSVYGAYFLNPNITGSYNFGLCGQGTPIGGRAYGIQGYVPLSATSTGNLNYGVYGSAFNSTPSGSGRSVGVQGYAGNSTSGWNYGVYGILAGGNNGAAIYGVTPGSGDEDTQGIYAGYFRGNVYISTQLSIGYKTASYMLDVNGIIRGTNVTPSDERLKDNIKDISGALTSLTSLRGVTYQLKSNGIESITSANRAISVSRADTGNVQMARQMSAQPKEAALYNRNHIGFVAQDIRKIYPELVYEDKDGILSVDYVSMIPIVVESVKELDKKTKTIDTLSDQLAKLSERLAALEKQNEELRKLIQK